MIGTTLYILAVLALVALFLLGPLFIYTRKVNEYKVATKTVINNPMEMYFRYRETCLHVFPQTNDGGVVCLTNQRIIHRHSNRFTLPFSADYDAIEKMERDNCTITITLKNGSKQRIRVYRQDVLRLFELMTYQFKKANDKLL